MCDSKVDRGKSDGMKSFDIPPFLSHSLGSGGLLNYCVMTENSSK